MENTHIQNFITKWSASGAAERANAQSFIIELCQILGVEAPKPKTPIESENAYVFEKTIPGGSGNKNFIDCYKRSHFVLEAKQGADATDDSKPLSKLGQKQRAKRKTGHGKRGTKTWDTAMEKARRQAENYTRRLPKEEIPDGRPPIIMVVDVGHSIALYADWSRAGGHYAPFPDPSSYRIPITDLVKGETQELLHTVWTNPVSLDPTRRSAAVTRGIADRLAKLAKSLEGEHSPKRVAGFLMRCLFTMFAEDVGLLPERSFTQLLDDLRKAPESFAPMIESLWDTMNTGGFSVILRQKLPQFNGGLFASSDVIELNSDQIQLLKEAADAQWKEVEPAIFGTLLERALDPRERHKLGAHYTPRAYVERLVQPTIIEPLRIEWEAVQVAALQLADQDEPAKARQEVEKFLQRLANLRILDPACGTGNFLYVTLELLKRLEGEILNTLQALGQGQISLEIAGVMVTPANMLGIEVNPRAAAIAELVLWIGFLQWHLRTRGDLLGLPEPIIRDLHNVECRDAVLSWDDRQPQLDKNGQPVTRWDGRTTKPHPITGDEIPDPTARVQSYEYIDPQSAEWPVVDYIVGNPPFIGTARMREALGDGYTEAIRKVYQHVPDSADYVMFWWDKAAEKIRNGESKRFGFITTNSLKQTFNRRVLQYHMGQQTPLSLVFAIPDHPWVDSVDGAAVRIAMTVGVSGNKDGRLSTIVQEDLDNDSKVAEIALSTSIGKLLSDLTIGADVASAKELKANSALANRGVQLIGGGFMVSPDQAKMLGLGTNATVKNHIRRYLNGRDLTSTSRGLMVIDLYGLSESDVRAKMPEVYQHVYENVKPQRDENRRKTYRDNWWIHGEPRSKMRKANSGLNRYISTVETSKHRFFVFLDAEILPDNRLVNFAFSDAYILGILSSRFHVTWVLASGGRLEDRPVYNKTRCFETFPFPTPTEANKTQIRGIAERLDALRKRQQKLHSGLGLTDMYNVLEKGRAGEPLTEKERITYENGLIGILRQLHDELDAAVAEAYGWPTNLEEGEILQRLVDLNTDRVAEEAKGLVRWLRPDYQAPEEVQQGKQGTLEIHTEQLTPEPVVTEKQPWPAELPARAAALREVLSSISVPTGVETIADAFKGRKTAKRLREVESLLDTLVALGQAESTEQEQEKKYVIS